MDKPFGASLTVDGLLMRARVLGLPRLDAQLMLAQVLGRERTWLLAHGDEPTDAAADRHFAHLCAQRAAGVPLAYLTGRREFFGLRLRITPDVLDPRADTETLVDWAIQRLAGLSRPAVLDLGTGSGAIALSIAHSCPAAQVTAVDRSASALGVAMDNARQLGLRLEGLRGDWFEAVAGRRFDLIVSNPPYLAEQDPHLAALLAEPREALVAGATGLEDLVHIVREAPAHLLPGGWLLLEHGAEQGPAVCEHLRRQGFQQVQHRQDMAGLHRCSGGRLVAGG
jgi:release factor glutamine methyltransferase